MQLSFLDSVEFPVLHDAFLKAFSDYMVPMQPTQEQLREMFVRRGADLILSAGAFENGELVGFTINAIDYFNKVLTVYDTGSGVIPEFRRRGISDAIFQFMLPKLRETGAQEYLLEVFEKNLPAVRLYEKTGFHTVRKFVAYRGVVHVRNPLPDFKIDEVDPDWHYWQQHWEWIPSWQNSMRSIERSKSPRKALGIFDQNTLIGYGIVYPVNGDIPQICIDSRHRRKNAGTRLMAALQEIAGNGSPVRIINVEATAEPTIGFLETLGLQIFGTQLEMRMKL